MNAVIALPILAFTSTLDPPRSSMMLPRPTDAETAATLAVIIVVYYKLIKDENAYNSLLNICSDHSSQS
ncbi:unnamed protein product [Schistosoma mattheei]|uniref:Uncharacterized protein n=1 Tax=Schistosoma mattheei TaxID=31246 RepID=A0A183P657_9TREM|nr:unnamed protein product [Schistosoma mattheei]